MGCSEQTAAQARYTVQPPPPPRSSCAVPTWTPAKVLSRHGMVLLWRGKRALRSVKNRRGAPPPPPEIAGGSSRGRGRASTSASTPRSVDLTLARACAHVRQYESYFDAPAPPSPPVPRKLHAEMEDACRGSIVARRATMEWSVGRGGGLDLFEV